MTGLHIKVRVTHKPGTIRVAFWIWELYDGKTSKAIPAWGFNTREEAMEDAQLCFGDRFPIDVLSDEEVADYEFRYGQIVI